LQRLLLLLTPLLLLLLLLLLWCWLWTAMQVCFLSWFVLVNVGSLVVGMVLLKVRQVGGDTQEEASAYTDAFVAWMAFFPWLPMGESCDRGWHGRGGWGPCDSLATASVPEVCWLQASRHTLHAVPLHRPGSIHACCAKHAVPPSIAPSVLHMLLTAHNLQGLICCWHLC
jgi:hypothetical protein